MKIITDEVKWKHLKAYISQELGDLKDEDVVFLSLTINKKEARP